MPSDALDMSLDDLVQGDKRGSGRGKGKGKSKRSRNGSENEAGAANKGKGKGWKKQHAQNDDDKAEKGDKLDMSLDAVIEKDSKKGKSRGKINMRADSEGKGKGKSRGKGKNGKGKERGYERDYDDDWSGRGSKGAGKGWGGKDRGGFNPYEPPSTSQYNEHDDRDDDDDDWDKSRGKGGRAGSFSYAAERERAERRPASTFGYGASRGDAPAPIRDGRRELLPTRRTVRSPARSKVVESRSAPTKRRATEDPAGGRAAKSVKVTNIPRNVDIDDLKSAFESETGRIARCRLERGTAWIAFSRPSDAQKAVDTFDRGELNGAKIGVALDQ